MYLKTLKSFLSVSLLNVYVLVFYVSHMCLSERTDCFSKGAQWWQWVRIPSSHSSLWDVMAPVMCSLIVNRALGDAAELTTSLLLLCSASSWSLAPGAKCMSPMLMAWRHLLKWKLRIPSFHLDFFESLHYILKNGETDALLFSFLPLKGFISLLVIFSPLLL